MGAARRIKDRPGGGADVKITMIATAGTLGCVLPGRVLTPGIGTCNGLWKLAGGAHSGPRHRQQLRTVAPFSPQLGTRVPTADAVPPSAPDERCP